jgi:hypothetical protein
MITADKVAWGSYQQYEGPWFRGVYSLPPMSPSASFEEKVLAVITATEGGHFDAINMYDRMICSVGLIQWGDAAQFSVCNMLGEVERASQGSLEALHAYVAQRGYGFCRTPKGFWRFSRPDGSPVDDVPAQHELYLHGGSGLKGQWTDEQKTWAKGLVVAMQSVWDSPRARDAQLRYTATRVKGFVMPSAYQRLFLNQESARADKNVVEATQAAFLSFAANLPAVAAKHLEQLVTSETIWTVEWLDAMVRELTFGPKIAIYPHRYNAIRPVIEQLWGVDLPDTSNDLFAWHGKMGIDPAAPEEVRLDTPKSVQQALVSLGADLGPSGCDGKWGAKSKAALVAFQQAHGLKPDGAIGPLTLAALRAALARLG